METSVGDTVRVVWGKQLISPVQFNTFEIGPFEMTTEVGPDETPGDAMQRAYEHLERFARSSYKDKIAAFTEAYKAARAVVRGAER